MKNLLKTLIETETCVGCGLCANCFPDKIKIHFDDGCYLPVLSEALNQTEIQQLERLCPITNQKYSEMSNARSFSKETGFYIGYYHGYSTDSDVRFRSATGGGITGLLLYLIQENVVDAVLQTRASMNPFQCETVISRTTEEILRCSGSIYAPNCLLQGLNKTLQEVERLAIVGKPCDLRAIDHYLREHTELRSKTIIKINFLCGGLPKLDSTYQVLNALGCKDPKQVESIRYRGFGWPGEFVAKLKDGSPDLTMSYADSWGKYLGRDTLLCCKLCMDSVGELADFTFGDAWVTDSNGYPVFNNSDGINLILTRSRMAESIFQDKTLQKYLFIEKASVAEFKKIQPSQAMRRTTALYKMRAAKFARLPFNQVSWPYLKKISNEKLGVEKKARSFLGALKRIIRIKK